MFRIKGGTKQVLTALCTSFDHEARVKLGHVVSSVRAGRDEALVTVSAAPGETKVFIIQPSSHTRNQNQIQGLGIVCR